MDYSTLANIVAQECGLVKDAPVLVGVSGGPDSLCLLHILYSLDYQVIAAHINHQLRPEAAAEADFVKGYCESLKIPFVYQQVDVRALAEEKKLSLEESARILRYTFLLQMAAAVSAQALAVAHQADDQVETVLMHLLRGAGSGGLKGMPYRAYLSPFAEDIPVVRPLLGMWRSEILAYCQQQQISPRFDASNTDRTYFRNRIRHELVPSLNTYNDQASQHLWQLAHIVGEEDRYLSVLAQQAMAKVVAQRGPGFVLIERQTFLAMDVVLQRRAARLILAELRNNLRDISYEAVQKLISYMTDHETHGEWQILDEVYLTASEAGQVLIYTDQADLGFLWPLLSALDGKPFYWPGEMQLNPHWKMLAACLPRAEANWTDEDKDQAFFDADLLTEPIHLGWRRVGERFTPFGMSGHSMKLGDYFTNNHFPARARQQWPILRMGEHILWVIGLRRGDFAPVTTNTRRVLSLRLVREA